MKVVFVIKLTLRIGEGYFDGNNNWAKYVDQARIYQTYTEAENTLAALIKLGNLSGPFQIEKFFINEPVK